MNIDPQEALKATVEMIALLIICDTIIRWFLKDKTRNLCGYIVLYTMTHCCAYACQLEVLSTLLWWTMPTCAILFIVMHQQLIQKNFICATTQDRHPHLPPETVAHEIVTAGLHGARHHQAVLFIIEGKQQIAPLLTIAFPVNSTLEKNMLSRLCNSSLYDTQAAILVTYNGRLHGINVTTKKNQKKETVCDLDYCQQLCAHTDSICVAYIDGQWTYIHQDTVLKQVQSNHLKTMLSKQLHTFYTKKDDHYESFPDTTNIPFVQNHL